MQGSLTKSSMIFSFSFSLSFSVSLAASKFLGFLLSPLISLEGSMTKSSSISHAFFLLGPPCAAYLLLFDASLLPLDLICLVCRDALCLGSSLLLVLLVDSPMHLHLDSSHSQILFFLSSDNWSSLFFESNYWWRLLIDEFITVLSVVISFLILKEGYLWDRLSIVGCFEESLLSSNVTVVFV